MIESVKDASDTLHEVLNTLSEHRDELSDIVRLLVDEFGNENLANREGAPVDDETYKYTMHLMERFDQVVDDVETHYRTLCLLYPYVARNDQ